jgi:hypothetical protein
MSCDRIRDGAGVLTAVFLLLWCLDFIAFVVVSLFVGGTYLYGYVGNGDY